MRNLLFFVGVIFSCSSLPQQPSVNAQQSGDEGTEDRGGDRELERPPPASQVPVEEAPPAGPPQTLLGPGAYVYQTRLDAASCEEDSTSGFVTSYFAAVDGTPGDRIMRMSLLNSQHWPTWSLRIESDDATITGMATLQGRTGAGVPTSHFQITRDGDQFEGRGYREFSQTTNGVTRRCRNEFDVLLRRIDMR